MTSGCVGLSSILWLPMLPAKVSCLVMLCAGLLSLQCRYGKIIAVLLFGMCWSIWQARLVYYAIPAQQINQSVSLSGQVLNMPRQLADAQQFILRVDQPGWLSNRLIRISWFRAEQTVKSGDHWQVAGRLRPVYGTVNPQGFDYARWLLSMRISGTLSVKSAAKLDKADRYSINFQRAAITDWINAALPVHSAATARALAIGDRSAVSLQQREALIRTGTGHLLAISGLHVGMVSMLGWLLGRLVYALFAVLRCRFVQYQLVQSLPVYLSLLTAAAYAMLAGMVVSAERALVMLMAAGLAMLLRRQFPSGRILMAALLLVLLLNPLVVLGAGFWLSFTAVFWLWWSMHGRLNGNAWWRQPVYLQLVLMLGMLPLQLIWFQQFSLAALPANIIAIPMVSLLILPVLLLAVLMHLASLPGAEILLQCAAGLLQGLQQMLSWLASYEYSALKLTPNPSHWSFLLAVIGSLWSLAPKGLPFRAVGLLLLLPLLFPVDNQPPPGHWEMQLFDIGQGQAMALRTANHVLVYDTGPGDGAGRDRLHSSILPLVQRWGGVVDKLMISHGDLDHAGGYRTAVDLWGMAEVSSSQHSLGAPCHAGQSWLWDGVLFRVLHPGIYLPYLGNDSSCVLLVESEYGRILIPGDISKAAEQRLVNVYADLQADVLIVPHHGSKTSSSATLLSAVSPSWALVSTGRWNRFDMPHSVVRQRFSELDIPLFNTADCGAMQITTYDLRDLNFQFTGLATRRWWNDRKHCEIQATVIE